VVPLLHGHIDLVRSCHIRRWDESHEEERYKEDNGHQGELEGNRARAPPDPMSIGTGPRT
ncbi:unnamed protein product, partial [marine sediment metagenome]